MTIILYYNIPKHNKKLHLTNDEIFLSHKKNSTITKKDSNILFVKNKN